MYVRQVENFAVMVREFPRDMATDELRAVVAAAHPGTVAHVQRVYRTTGVWKHLEERERVGIKASFCCV